MPSRCVKTTLIEPYTASKTVRNVVEAVLLVSIDTVALV